MLFGHQNNDTALMPPPAPPTSAAGINPLAVDPATGVSLPVPPAAPPVDEPDEPSILNQPTSVPDLASSLMSFAPTATPKASSEPQPASFTAPGPTQDETDLPDVEPQPEPVTEPNDAPAMPARTPSNVSSDDLLSLKAQALTQLSPLVDQLDQTPEEKFRTTMMFIQTTDDPARIPTAYKAAQSIEDEKVRAQALLDVINEINYFTQTKPSEASE